MRNVRENGNTPKIEEQAKRRERKVWRTHDRKNQQKRDYNTKKQLKKRRKRRRVQKARYTPTTNKRDTREEGGQENQRKKQRNQGEIGGNVIAVGGVPERKEPAPGQAQKNNPVGVGARQTRKDVGKAHAADIKQRAQQGKC